MWHELWTRLIQPRNWLSLIVLVVAVFGMFGIPQQALKITDQQVIVALLIFIMVEQIGGNLLYLATLEKKLDKVQGAATSIGQHNIDHTHLMHTLAEKLDKVRIEATGIEKHYSRTRKTETVKELIEKSTWMRVSGVTLDNFIGNFGKVVEDRAEAGAEFEFLMSDEAAKFLDELSPSHFYSGAKYRADIGSAIGSFRGLSTAAKQHVQLRKSPTVPFGSVIQVRLADGTEYMAVEHYLYKIEGGAARSFELDRVTSPGVFAYYEAAENRRWADAIVVSL